MGKTFYSGIVQYFPEGLKIKVLRTYWVKSPISNFNTTRSSIMQNVNMCENNWLVTVYQGFFT